MNKKQMNNRIQDEKDKIVTFILDSHFTNKEKLQIITSHELWPIHPFTLDPLEKEEKAFMRFKQVREDKDVNSYLSYSKAYVMFCGAKEGEKILFSDMASLVKDIKSAELKSGRRKVKLIVDSDVQNKIVNFAIKNKKLGFILD